MQTIQIPFLPSHGNFPKLIEKKNSGVPLSLFRSGHQAAAHGVTDTQQFASLCTMARSGIQALVFRQTSQKIL